MSPHEFIKKHGIGITGGIATGKSTVSKWLRESGFLVFDADVFARNVVSKDSEVLFKIQRDLGDAFMREDGNLDRGRLRDAMSKNPEIKKTLEKIVHPAIEKELESNLREFLNIEQDKNQVFFYEAALLVEANRAKDFREVWLIHCSKSLQTDRLVQRDGVSKPQAKRLIEAQCSIEEKRKHAHWELDTSSGDQDVQTKLFEYVKSSGLCPLRKH